MRKSIAIAAAVATIGGGVALASSAHAALNYLPCNSTVHGVVHVPANAVVAPGCTTVYKVQAGAEGTVFDFGGHTATALGNATTLIDANGENDVVVKNGTATGFRNAVDAPGTEGLHVTNMILNGVGRMGDGIDLGNDAYNATVNSVKISNFYDGIDINDPAHGLNIHDVALLNNAWGIYANDVINSTFTRIASSGNYVGVELANTDATTKLNNMSSYADGTGVNVVCPGNNLSTSLTGGPVVTQSKFVLDTWGVVSGRHEAIFPANAVGNLMKARAAAITSILSNNSKHVTVTKNAFDKNYVSVLLAGSWSDSVNNNTVTTVQPFGIGVEGVLDHFSKILNNVVKSGGNDSIGFANFGSLGDIIGNNHASLGGGTGYVLDDFNPLSLISFTDLATVGCGPTYNEYENNLADNNGQDGFYGATEVLSTTLLHNKYVSNTANNNGNIGFNIKPSTDDATIFNLIDDTTNNFNSNQGAGNTAGDFLNGLLGNLL